MTHVADGVDVDEETNARDHENHDARERVEKITPIGDERDKSAGSGDGTRRNPFEKDLLVNALAGLERKEFEDGTEGMDEGEENAANAKEADSSLGQQAAEEKHQRRRDQRKERDEPEMREEIVGGGHGRGVSST
jgi:hypothetical protein